jgi:hypothetical protein
MDEHLFASFCVLIDDLPAGMMIQTAETQRHIIEDDLRKQRILLTEDIRSILAFCNFLEAIVHGSSTILHEMSTEHLAFYGKVVRRLVEAGELHVGNSACKFSINNQAGIVNFTRAP